MNKRLFKQFAKNYGLCMITFGGYVANAELHHLKVLDVDEHEGHVTNSRSPFFAMRNPETKDDCIVDVYLGGSCCIYR